jgi:hypothetical protein
VSSVAARARAEPGRPWVDRLLAAAPILSIFAWFGLLHAWQAWGVATPWVFTDELELAQLSRSFAEHGEPSRRGDVYWSVPLSVFLTAPAWLLDRTETAYDAAKYLGALAMTAAAFPAYGLARMLVSRGPALFAAAATVTIPAFMYGSLLLEEPFAYPTATLTLYLTVRALARPSRGRIAAAAAACVVAPFVRTQLAVLPAILLLGGLTLAWGSEPARRWRRSWRRWDWIGATALAVGLAVLANEVIAHASESWLVATRLHKDRMLEYGVWAGGALALGVGVVPLLAAFASAAWRGRDDTAALRAFRIVLWWSFAAFGFYAAVKAAYLSTQFATRIAERNLIYLAPILFAATALWLERPRIRPLGFAFAVALCTALVLNTEIALDYPYFEAPGFTILALANRHFALSLGTIHDLLPALVAFAALLVALPAVLERRRPRACAALAAAAAVFVLAWNVTGQLGAADASASTADRFLANFPSPPNWVDEATGGAPTMYLGQKIDDATAVWLLEFWNRSIKYVWSLDGTAPGPGATGTPDVGDPEGRFLQQRGEVRYVVADAGVEVVGKVVARPTSAAGRPGNIRLYQIEYPIRLTNAVSGLYADGWMGDKATYSRYATPGSRPGYAVVTLSRKDWDVATDVHVRLGTLVFDSRFRERIGRVTAERTARLPALGELRLVLPAPPPPFRVVVEVAKPFVPAELDQRIADRRRLGAVASFAFTSTPPPGRTG